MSRWIIPCAAILGFSGVACGAFGAHALKDQLSANSLQIWQTAVQYQIAHALAILAVGVLLSSKPSRILERAAGLFAVGVVIFSGSLYVLAISGLTWLGAVTPLGGLCFLAGWALLGVGSLKASA